MEKLALVALVGVIGAVVILMLEQLRAWTWLYRHAAQRQGGGRSRTEVNPAGGRHCA